MMGKTKFFQNHVMTNVREMVGGGDLDWGGGELKTSRSIYKFQKM